MSFSRIRSRQNETPQPQVKINRNKLHIKKAEIV